jgi:uncharacterized surface protein with fasciclin (FAS1) repeats
MIAANGGGDIPTPFMKTKKLIHVALLASFTATVPLALAEPATSEMKDKEMKMPMKEMKMPMIEKGSLSSVIADSATFSTLKKALVAADLEVTLGSKGAYTVFAPTDEAFDKLPVGVLAKLMLPENKEKLRSLLLYHVIAGKMLSTELKDGEVKTMNGEKVNIDVDGMTVKLDDSKVFSADVMATNGVMHSLGTVLMPKSMKDFSSLTK